MEAVKVSRDAELLGDPVSAAPSRRTTMDPVVSYTSQLGDLERKLFQIRKVIISILRRDKLVFASLHRPN